MKFSQRAFVSLSLLFWTLELLVNGIVLYIAPPGRDAHWVNWTFWGLDKDQWGAMHTIGGFLFVVFAVWHILLNLKPMLAYIASKAESAMRHKAELGISFAIFVLLTAGAALDIPPFAQVMNYGEQVKEGWIPAAQKPEIAHGELLRLEDLCSRLGRDYGETLEKAAAAGLRIEEDKILQYNAEKNGLSPAELYEALFGKQKTSSGLAEGGGYGRKTVEGLSAEYSVPLADALARLKARGCEAEAGSNLRELASSCGITPIEAAAAIKGE